MRFRVQVPHGGEVRAGPILHNTVQTFQVARSDQAGGLTTPLPGKISITTANLFR